MSNYSDKIRELKKKIDEADAIVIGAGAGLSTAAGYIYSGERFDKYFPILAKNTALTICIRAAFIRTKRPRNSGRSGQDTSTLTAICRYPRTPIQSFLIW
jgi:hypothetical protein